MKKALQRRRNSESLLLLALKKVADKISGESIPFRELKDKNVDRVALHQQQQQQQHFIHISITGFVKLIE